MRNSKSKSFGVLALFLVTGAILGGILGEIIASTAIFSGIAPYLVKTFSIFDLPPIAINLYVIKLVLGFSLSPNLISILGLIIAALLFRRF